MYCTSHVGASSNSAGFFDIFGFEVMPTNSLEQLCINYANEKLQQLFIERCLRHEQQLYVEEGLDWNNINVADNAACVELIEGRYQLFQLLNEVSRFGLQWLSSIPLCFLRSALTPPLTLLPP